MITKSQQKRLNKLIREHKESYAWMVSAEGYGYGNDVSLSIESSKETGAALQKYLDHLTTPAPKRPKDPPF